MKTEIAAAQDNAVRREKRKASVRRGLFIASFIGIPILHFRVFFVYTNADTILLSFQTFDNSLANTQSQTCPLRKVIDLIEPLEDMADTFFRNADSRIFLSLIHI